MIAGIVAAGVLAAGGGGGGGYFTTEDLTEASSSSSSAKSFAPLVVAAADIVPNGKYLLIWSCDIGKVSGNSGQMYATLRVNGSSVYGQWPQMKPVESASGSPPDYVSFGGVHAWTAPATPVDTTFDIWYSYNQNILHHIRNGRVTLLPLGADDHTAISAARQTTTSSTAIVAATFTFTPGSVGDYAVLVHGLLDLASASNVDYRLNVKVNGTTVTNEQVWRPAGSSDRMPFLFIIPLAAISTEQTITVEYHEGGSGSTTVGISELRMVALRKDRFANVYHTTLGSDNSSSTSSYVTALSQTFTPAAADHLTIVGAPLLNASGGNSSFIDYDDGGVQVGEAVRENSIFTSHNLLGLATHRLVAYAASSRTQAIRRRSETAFACTVKRGASILTLDLTGI